MHVILRTLTRLFETRFLHMKCNKMNLSKGDGDVLTVA